MFKIFSSSKPKTTALDIGKTAELKAAKFLRKNGLKILEQNFHSRFGEIDIIAEDDEILHFVEVKASEKYDALARITPSKMEKIVKTIEYYMMKNDSEKDFQIDALVLEGGKIEWIKNIN
ncbi:MAG: YraN family protein [Campylobacteraceae bacterium]|jgi:putative endonuclease|nr:YraN family protein [Campylobacteraceae bacterium]